MTRLSKNTRAPLVALTLAVATLPAFAQPTTSSTTGVGGTTATVDRRDDGFDWGWLGLLGLAGLAGLKRRDDTATTVRRPA